MKKLIEWIEDELKPLLWVITRGDVRRCQIKIYIIPRLEIHIPYVQRQAYWESKLKKLIADRQKEQSIERQKELDEIPF